jgi:hypothetical protein
MFVSEPEAQSPGLKRKMPAALRPQADSLYIGNRQNGQYSNDEPGSEHAPGSTSRLI